MTIPSNLDRYAGRLAAIGAAAIAIVSALAGHHMGVSHGIGEAALIRDDARVTMEACYEALESAERTALVTLAAQETFREVRAERMEAMTTTTSEVDR